MSRIETIVLEGTLTPDQRLTYPLLPFTVPAHTARIDVRHSYASPIGSDPSLTDGNTVDIGIFDPRGHAFMEAGFRGWSGSARADFFISPKAASPGYMPGAIQPGMWHICLGAYKIAEVGCPYRIDIALTIDDADLAESFPARLALSAQPRTDIIRDSGWYRGDLHCHTYHSDGDSAPQTVIERAEALGLDFLAITDHNAVSHQVELAEAQTRLMLIPGMEVTTYRGHWNIWGAGPWIDFRVQSAADMQAAVDAALQAGYLISCNHPRPFGPEWAYPEVRGFHCIEVWNGPWLLMNEAALAYWEARLRSGKRCAAVGGSDSHFHTRDHPAKLATPTTFIYCAGAPSPAALLDGLRAGHAFISESPDGAEVYLSAGSAMMGDALSTADDTVNFSVHVRRAAGKQLQIVTNTGVVQQFAVTDAEWMKTVPVDVRSTPYVRAQVVSGEQGRPIIHALTNPIYIEHPPH
jgi:hypothetical protein